MADYDAIVIGAGLGGLSTGALLAKQGRKVLLLENQSFVGGRCSSFKKDGFQFDLGATIMEIIETEEELFRLLGTTFEKEIEPIPIEPIYEIVFKDKSRMTVPHSIEGTAEKIAEISPEDSKAFYEFAKFMQGLYKDVSPAFFSEPMDSVTDVVKFFARHPGILRRWKLFFNSWQDVVVKYFKNNNIQQSMALQSFYVGLPPALAPGILSIAAYSEHEGTYYPKEGGMGALPEAIRRCGERFGMEVKLNQLVKKVVVNNRRAEGVVLEGGESISADIVVSGIDAKNLYLDLIGEEHLPWLAKYGIKSWQIGTPVITICMGVDYRPPLGAHHTSISLPFEEMENSYLNYYKKGLPWPHPVGLVCCPSFTVPSAAPEGCHSINLALTCPSTPSTGTKNWDWEKEKEPYTEHLIDWISDVGILPDLKEHIKVIQVITPLDYERQLFCPGGNFTGYDQDLFHQAVFRSSCKSKSIKGLYVAGTSAHPGVGVPLAVGSGIIAANLIEKSE